MIGAGGGGATPFQEMKPEEVGEDRATEHQEGEGEKKPFARDDVADIGEDQRDRRERDAGSEILDAVADPEAALRREQLEQQGAGDDRGERGQRKQDAM